MADDVAAAGGAACTGAQYDTDGADDVSSLCKVESLGRDALSWCRHASSNDTGHMNTYEVQNDMIFHSTLGRKLFTHVNANADPAHSTSLQRTAPRPRGR